MKWIDVIKNYIPNCEQEKKDKELILKLSNTYDNLLYRDNEFFHITVSSYILNNDRTKVLMIYHNIYDSWSWVGGHADGEEDSLKVAIKEGKEETGIINLTPISEDIASLEILTVDSHYKNNKYVAPHLHLNLTYFLLADESDELKIKPDENSGVMWIKLNDIEKYSTEPKMIEIYKKLNEKVKMFNK